MAYLKFDSAKLERLNDPGRFESIPPARLWEALGEPAHARVIIEVGAGTGMFAAAFSELAPHATVYATDIEDSMLEWMRLNRPQVAEGRIVALRSEESHVPLADGIADVLFMINLHHELAEPDAMYAEACRLLRPRGQLLVVDWAVRETPKGPPMTVRVSTAQLEDHLHRAGFKNVHVDDGILEWHTLATAVCPV